MTTNTFNNGLNTETQKSKNAKLFEIRSWDICTLTPTKRPLSTLVCIKMQHNSESRTTVALMLNFKIQNPLTTVARKGHYNIYIFCLSYRAIISTYRAISLNNRAFVYNRV